MGTRGRSGYRIDAPELEQVRERWEASGHWTFVQGNDLDIDWLGPGVTGTYCSASTRAATPYDHTLLERLRKYVPLVKPGGVVYLHDTKLETPELVGPTLPYPVARALDTFCAETGQGVGKNSVPSTVSGKIAAPNG